MCIFLHFFHLYDNVQTSQREMHISQKMCKNYTLTVSIYRFFIIFAA